MKTYSAKPEDIKRAWVMFDAEGVTLGRLATQIAVILQGKHKPTYCRHMDMGDAVVIINADKIRVTGKKEEDKVYYHYSGYPSGMKARTVAEMRKKRPIKILELAVERMLPKGPLGRDMYRKMFVYPGAEHPHSAQQPQLLQSQE